MEASMRRRRYPSDLTDLQWAGATREGQGPAANDGYACRIRRHPLPAPDGLPMAAAASGFPALADGARLFPALAHRRLLDRSAPCTLPTGPRCSRPKLWTDSRHYGWSVGQDERKGGVRGFDGHKRVKGRKRHILVDVLGLPLANRVEPANMPDPVAGSRLLAGLTSLWPTIRTVIADDGHTSRKLAGQLRRDGWQLRVFKRRQRVFAIAGLTWIVERSFAWLGFSRRLAKDYEHRVQTSETLISIAAIRLMLNRIAPE